MENQSFNLHTHTARCGHACGFDIQYVESAIESGFTLLGFSDHIPFKGVHMPGDRMLYEQKEEYFSSIRKLQQQFEGKITIKIGFEIEYLEERCDELLQMKKECDYMILGQHLKYMNYEYDCYCSDEDVLTYVTQIESALGKNLVTYVAHPDYFMLGRRHFSDVCEKAAHRIAAASIKHDIPLEINLNGFKYGKQNYQFDGKPGIFEERYPYPLREFWEIVSSYGCKVVYGYDAHSPITLLEKDRVLKANELLSNIKLNFCEDITLK